MAAVDYFLKIDGIQGESQDKTHKNEIEIESFSWGENNSGTAAKGGGMGAGRVAMQDFHFVMGVNKASPKLMLACATGEHIKNAILVCRKAGKEQQEYLKITFSDLLISSFQTGGASVMPVDQIAERSHGHQAPHLPLRTAVLYGRIRSRRKATRHTGRLGERSGHGDAAVSFRVAGRADPAGHVREENVSAKNAP
jgi:type VI secretion system secreted protein Hcp